MIPTSLTIGIFAIKKGMNGLTTGFVCRPPSSVRRQPSVVSRPPSAVRRPPSVVRRRVLHFPIIKCYICAFF
ncbi:MAG TPA: hypothetical protein ENJ53_08640 [Phaeodactylibacter sp.]|nr:hypothetical protein [Phaeodactylibacter sp.]